MDKYINIFPTKWNSSNQSFQDSSVFGQWVPQEAVLQEAYPPGACIPGGSATTRLLFPGLIVLDNFIILTYVMDTYINVFPIKWNSSNQSFQDASVFGQWVLMFWIIL